MSLNTNRKILIGSVMQSLDKRLIFDDISNDAVISVSIVINYINYAISQYNIGNKTYFDKIKQLNKLIHELKYKCSDICVYKDKSISNL